MFKALKQKYGNYQLSKLLNRRKHTAIAVNFDHIKRLGVIYPANNEAQFIEVKSLLDSLPNHINFSTLGYADAKALSNFHIQPAEYRFFCHEDFNWYFKPVSDIVCEFISTPFDVLIDLSEESSLPIQFVLAESHARLIAGRFQDDTLYDFMIKPTENKTDEYFFEQLIRYLKMIKTK
ncbi:MAG: hypothetical protein U9N51_04800 [Bacteroidota bacterium]|nr:hypothetical protein [Bacteroidota bacterium]